MLPYKEIRINPGLAPILFLALMFSLTSNAKELPEGLVLYYKADEANVKEIKDWSNFGNTGVIKGNPEWTEGTKGMGKALRFKSNSDYIEVADAESIKPKHITIALWIKSELTAGSIETLRKFE